MKWVNHVAIAGAVTAVWKPELVPVAVLGSTAPDWMEWVYARATGGYVARGGAHSRTRKPQAAKAQTTKPSARHSIMHRCPTHVVMSWVAGLAFGLFVWDWHHALAAFCAGGLSHVLCDALTVQGVPLGWWSDRRFHLFGGRLRTGQMGEYWVAGAVLLACVGLSTVTRHWGEDGFSPFFYDWEQMYRDGKIDAKEWKENRFRWL